MRNSEALVQLLLVDGKFISTERSQVEIHFCEPTEPPAWSYIVRPTDSEYYLYPYLNTAYKTIQEFGMVNGYEYLADKTNHKTLALNIARKIRSLGGSLQLMESQLEVIQKTASVKEADRQYSLETFKSILEACNDPHMRLYNIQTLCNVAIKRLEGKTNEQYI